MSRGPKGLGSVYKEKTEGRRTSWRAEKWVRLPDGTSKRVIARGRTEAEAIKKRAQREAALARAHPDADRLTMRAFLKRWLESKRDLKPNTLREYERIVEHTVEMIGAVPLSRVTPLHVQRLMDAHSAPTANAIRRYLKGAFRQAERWELITLNPVRNLEAVKRPAPRRGVWQPDEIQTFLDGSRGIYRAMFTLAIFSGLRRGELLALPWENVTSSSVLVDRTWTRGGVVGTPKTDSSYRTVPIHESVYEVVAAARAKQGTSDLAFPSRRGTLLSDGNLGRAYRDALDRSGVKRIRFHDMRRVAATLWAAQGHGPKVIQKLLGHSTPHLAMAIYTDVMRSQVLSAALDPAAIGGKNGGLKLTPTRTNEGSAGEQGEADAASDAGE